MDACQVGRQLPLPTEQLTSSIAWAWTDETVRDTEGDGILGTLFLLPSHQGISTFCPCRSRHRRFSFFPGGSGGGRGEGFAREQNNKSGHWCKFLPKLCAAHPKKNHYVCLVPGNNGCLFPAGNWLSLVSFINMPGPGTQQVVISLKIYSALVWYALLKVCISL